MVCDLRYLLISLVAHIVFFSFFYFVVYSAYSKLQNLTIISKGSVMCMSIVSNEELFNVNKKVINTIKKEYIYPKDTKSEVNITNENQVSHRAKSNASDGSGGTGNALSEVIPVINNDDIIHCTSPSYPSSSLALGEEGIVVVRLLVDTDGNIINCKLHKTSGFKSLDNSVMQSLKLWVVKRIPTQKTWIEVSVSFFIS